MKKRARDGFTAVELVMVLIIGALLISAGMRSFAGLQATRDLGNARDAVIYLSHRAKSEAMKRGNLVRLQILPDSDAVRILTATDSVVTIQRLDEEYGADLIGARIQLCYSGRGFALSSCSSSGLPKALGFVRTSDTLRAIVLPLGQIEKR